MKQAGVKIAAGVLAAAITFTGVNIEAMASAGGVSNVLPAGGVSLSMMNETSLASIQNDDKSDKKVESNVQITQIADIATATASNAKALEDALFKNLVIAKVNKYVNVRSLPSEEGEIVGKLYDKSVGTFISETDGWYQITSGNVTGYVKAEYCVTGDAAAELAREVGNRIATVAGTASLRVRTEPSTEAATLNLIAEGEQLLVLEETDEWAKVNIEEGDGWINKEYVSIETEFIHAESKAEEEARLAKEAEERRKAQEAAAKATAKSGSSNSGKTNSSSNNAQPPVTVGEGSELGVAVAEFAVQFVGYPYKWGGTSLTEGADCSGFVMSVYANFGVSLPHSSAADRKQGYAVDGLENAQPGDLICYSGHVALYIGNGQIVHASTKKTGIIISNADYKKILAIRRIF